jgi:predicted negative regulator of RcsB-dependent stress response
MSFLRKLFARGPEDYLGKGEGHFAVQSYYEARSAFEAGLHACREKAEHVGLAQKLEARICETNRAMAQLNMLEAEHALRQGAIDKALEHLELAKTLTEDANIREKADQLLAGLEYKSNTTEAAAPAASCSSCSQGSPDVHAAPPETDADLPVLEHYDLLIRQLPEEMYERYSSLGEDFACMFIAASRDSHQEALDLLEKWFDGSQRDIYCYEKGKILHRLGRIGESETSLRESIGENSHNPLPHLGLALLLIDDNRLDEAARQLDLMIAGELFTGQALMMRGEVFQLAGESEAAIRLYGKLLDTPLARAAAEKLHELLLECNRQPEAAHIYKRYLGNKCQH